MKSLPPGSYLVRPFKTYKEFNFTHTYLGTNNSPFITVDEAIAPPVGWVWDGANEPYNPESGLFKRPLYASLETLFYASASISGTNLQHTLGALSASRALPVFEPGGWSPGQTGDVYIISVSEGVFGEQIRPGTFNIITGAGTGSITDDGKGRLYVNTNPTNAIGNIFYSMGIAAISKMPDTGSITGSVINQDGMYLNTGSSITIDYHSQLTLFEHSVICTIEKDEFNFTVNPSLSLFASSSVTGSTRLLDAFSSGTLTPYVTTIGCYDSVGELLMVGKVPRPIRRTTNMDQTFVVRLDA